MLMEELHVALGWNTLMLLLSNEHKIHLSILIKWKWSVHRGLCLKCHTFNGWLSSSHPKSDIIPHMYMYYIVCVFLFLFLIDQCLTYLLLWNSCLDGSCTQRVWCIMWPVFHSVSRKKQNNQYTNKESSI